MEIDRGGDMSIESSLIQRTRELSVSNAEPPAVMWRHREAESRVLEVLQQQNEHLRCRLDAIITAMDKREECEIAIGNLLREFKGVLKDVASAGAADGAANETSGPLPAPSRALSGSSKKLFSVVSSIDAQWTEARKAARKAATVVSHGKRELAMPGIAVDCEHVL